MEMSMPTVTARSLKVTVVLDAATLLAVPVRDGQPRTVLNVRLPDRTVSADLNTKSVRKAIAAITEFGPDGCSAIIQGRLNAGDIIVEAGLVVQPKMAKVPAAA
jgi:hypothetical protein